MESDIELQLEALNQVVSWSKWLIAIAGAALAVGIGSSRYVNEDNRQPTKILLTSFSISFITAIILVANSPYIAQNLPIGSEYSYHVFSFQFSGIYAVKHFGFIPFWFIQLVQQISFIIGSIAALRILWFEYFKHGFFPILLPKRKSDIILTTKENTNFIEELSTDWSRITLNNKIYQVGGKKYTLRINTLSGETIELFVSCKNENDERPEVLVEKL